MENEKPVGNIMSAYAMYECEECGEVFQVAFNFVKAAPLDQPHEDCKEA
ncbi:hypothetical protein [Streptomyces sp. NPDC051561]